jgi:MFS family permease
MNDQSGLRTFYTLILTQVFSLVGSHMSDLALSIYIYSQTGDVTPLALVSVFGTLPQVIAAGFAGVLADRWDRRWVMMLSDAGQALGTVVLLVLFVSGGFQLWHLYAITLIKSIFGVFQSPAFQASVTMLVPDEQRGRANALQQLTGPASGVVAPALAGVLYALVGLSGIILIDLITFAIAAVVVMLVHIPRPEQTAVGKAMQGSVWREFVGGLRFLWDWRPLFYLTLHVSLVNFLFSAAGVLFTPYLLARTGSEAMMGVLLGVTNIGMIAGGVLMGVWGGTKQRIHTIMPGIIVSGIFLALVGTARAPLVLGVFLFLMVFAVPMINAAAMSLMQAKVPPDIQGRVFAVLGQLSMLLMPVAYLLVGPLADNVFEPAVASASWERVAPLVGSEAGAGMGLIMVVSGVVLTVLTALVYAIPSIRRFESTLPDYVATPVETAPHAASAAAD